MKVNHIEVKREKLETKLEALQYVRLGTGPGGKIAYLSPAGYLIEITVGKGRGTEVDAVQSIEYTNKVEVV